MDNFETIAGWGLGGVIVFFILRPLINTLINSLLDGFKEINKTLKENSESIIKAVESQGELTRSNIGKKTLPDRDLIEIAESMVLAASFEKLTFLREKLIQNNLKTRQPQIEKAIRAKLEKFSENYIKNLNKYKFSNGQLVGDWIAENFPMDSFCEDIYKIFFRELEGDIEVIRHDKINDIQVLMITEQGILWTKARQEFNC